MLTPKLVTTSTELAQIAHLSDQNLVTKISAEQKALEGFVTWEYPLETLHSLHNIIPSVVVMDGEKLAGYAISLTRECVDVYPPLDTDIRHFATLLYKGRPLLEHRVYFMGQICVDPDYRGQGVVKMLYDFHRKAFSDKYDVFVTLISQANPRSFKAHEKVGFKVIGTQHDEDSAQEWDVVAWDWAG